jgi:predicted DNA-binding transcriptional regulator AlpA
MPTVPIEQQSPHPGAKHTTAAKTAVPDNQPNTSANAIRGPPPAGADKRKARTAQAKQGNPRLWDSATTRAYFGGIDISTLYRGMAAGRYPRPVLVSEHTARWLAEECEAALDRLIAARDEPRKKPEHRGRPRGSRREREAAKEAASAVKAKTAAEVEPTA